MGVACRIDGNTLVIEGGEPIHGNKVRALDLRAGAALLLIAMVADSPTEIEDFWMIERGYDNVKSLMKNIGIKFEK